MGSTGSSSPATTTKRVVVGLGLLVISGLGPWAFLMLLGWPNVANAAVVPGMALTILCITGTGWRAGILIVGPFAVLSGLAVWALLSPWLAAMVLAVAAFVRGYAAREGLHDALILTVIAMGFLVTTPPQFTTTVPAPIVVAIVTLFAGLWAVAVMFVVRTKIPHVKLAHLDPIRVLVYSLALAALVGIATYLAVYYDLGQTGGWIILTVLVVFQPYLGWGFKKGGLRALGTLAGLGITVAVGLVFPTGPVLYVFGLLFFVVTFLFLLQKRPYWLYAMVVTPGVVLMNSATSTVDVVAVERLKGTALGIAFTVLVMLALLPLVKHLEAKPPALPQ